MPDKAASSEPAPGVRMFNYRIERQQDDGSWSVQEFESADDTDAITHGLRVRTANRCELYQADRWLATFDGVADAANVRNLDSSALAARSSVEIESEVAYFRRRATEEKNRCRNAVSAAARLAHHRMAEHLESLARVVEAVQRRRTFYDVNASRRQKPAPLKTRTLCR